MEYTFVGRRGSVARDQGLLNQALSFLEAGSRCAAQISLTPRKFRTPLVPAIVCYAFAVELYLKLLLVLSKVDFKKEHRLELLFGLLPASTQDDLTKAYGDPSLAKDLAEVGSAFVVWRYEHEYEQIGIDPRILLAVADACHRVVRTIAPNLLVFGENSI